MKFDIIMEMLQGMREVFDELSDLEKQRVKAVKAKRHNQGRGEQ